MSRSQNNPQAPYLPYRKVLVRANITRRGKGGLSSAKNRSQKAEKSNHSHTKSMNAGYRNIFKNATVRLDPNMLK